MTIEENKQTDIEKIFDKAIMPTKHGDMETYVISRRDFVNCIQELRTYISNLLDSTELEEKPELVFMGKEYRTDELKPEQLLTGKVQYKQHEHGYNAAVAEQHKRIKLVKEKLQFHKVSEVEELDSLSVDVEKVVMETKNDLENMLDKMSNSFMGMQQFIGFKDTLLFYVVDTLKLRLKQLQSRTDTVNDLVKFRDWLNKSPHIINVDAEIEEYLALKTKDVSNDSTKLPTKE